MMDMVDPVVRASVVMLLALAAVTALRRRSAGLRHLVLAAGIFSAASVVPLSLALPEWDLPLPSRASTAALVESIGGSTAADGPARRRPHPTTASRSSGCSSSRGSLASPRAR